MIAEAVDTLRTPGWALAAWIVLTAGAVTLALWTVGVAMVWACRAVWRMAAWAWRGPRRGLYAHLPAERPATVPESPRAADRRSAIPPRPAPSWARTDKEAA